MSTITIETLEKLLLMIEQVHSDVREIMRVNASQYRELEERIKQLEQPKSFSGD